MTKFTSLAQFTKEALETLDRLIQLADQGARHDYHASIRRHGTEVIYTAEDGERNTYTIRGETWIPDSDRPGRSCRLWLFCSSAEAEKPAACAAVINPASLVAAMHHF